MTDTSLYSDRDASAFVAEVRALFPWMEQMDLDPRWLQEVAATSAGPDEVLAQLRQSPQYQARFPGLYRSDGSVRMNEAQYMAREADYRNLLRQFGYDPEQYSTPTSLVGFFDSEMDPNELGERLETYRNVTESSQAQKDAFYVYAGLQVSDDDLYEAVVDPAARQRLSDEYNRRVAGETLDYETWVTRATEVGLQRVADRLQMLQDRGAVAGEAVQSVLSVDTSFARQIMDAIYTGGAPGESSGTLSLDETLSSFEFAAVGAAASNAGLEMPTRERLAEIRAAGVQTQRQIEGYQNFGLNRDRYDSASLRSGGGGFTQEEFEGAAFFGDVDASRELEAAVTYEEAQGRSSGEFRFAENNGRLVQRGLGR